MSVRVLVLMAIGATVGFPLLALSGVEVESSHVTAVAFTLAALALLVLWLGARRLVARFSRWRRGR